MAEAERPASTRDVERLGFLVGGTLYAIPTSEVIEVQRPRPLARVPHAPPSLLGVVNLRGAILPVVSAARLLEAGGSTAAARSSRILVLDHRPICGLLVEAVTGLVRDAALPFDAAGLLKTAVTSSATVSRRASGAAHSQIIAPIAGEVDDSLAVLGFAVAGQAYALPLTCIIEIMPAPRDFQSVADADPSIMGLVAQRGTLLPVVSLGRLLSQGEGGRPASLVVIRLAGGDVALAVDDVRAILRLPRATIDAVPAVLTRGTGETRIEGIARIENGALIAILSPDRLFNEATQQRLSGRVDHRVEAEADEAMDDALEQFVVVTMDGEHFGLPIASVEEVVRRPNNLSPLPRSPSFVLGVMNLRGQAVPVLDGRSRFGAAVETGGGNRVVVVSLQGLRAGFAVDAVDEIIAVPASAITPAPDFVRAEGAGGDAFRRIADHHGRLVFLVEPDALLAKAERDALAAAAINGSSRAKKRQQAAAPP